VEGERKYKTGGEAKKDLLFKKDGGSRLKASRKLRACVNWARDLRPDNPLKREGVRGWTGISVGKGSGRGNFRGHAEGTGPRGTRGLLQGKVTRRQEAGKKKVCSYVKYDIRSGECVRGEQLIGSMGITWTLRRMTRGVCQGLVGVVEKWLLLSGSRILGGRREPYRQGGRHGDGRNGKSLLRKGKKHCYKAVPSQEGEGTGSEQKKRTSMTWKVTLLNGVLLEPPGGTPGGQEMLRGGGESVHGASTTGPGLKEKRTNWAGGELSSRADWRRNRFQTTKAKNSHSK